jgi:hypothetical protein
VSQCIAHISDWIDKFVFLSINISNNAGGSLDIWRSVNFGTFLFIPVIINIFLSLDASV